MENQEKEEKVLGCKSIVRPRMPQKAQDRNQLRNLTTANKGQEQYKRNERLIDVTIS